jgi:hypothetical protein
MITTFKAHVPWPPWFEELACCVLPLQSVPGVFLAIHPRPHTLTDDSSYWVCSEYSTGRWVARGNTPCEAWERALAKIGDNGARLFLRMIAGHVKSDGVLNKEAP